ncbi:hypothetical protein H311_01036 [Anncaliia algerae PRA109]|nr:hypothetical protein H311_01036 [Anncaliia algerae PRA109]
MTKKEWGEENDNIENSYDNWNEITSDCDTFPERIPFSNANCKKFGKALEPIEYFKRFFIDNLINQIINKTNLYAEERATNKTLSSR